MNINLQRKLKEDLMKEDQKKELEAKLIKLIFESERPKKSKASTSSDATPARVIRRRKGSPDLHIA
jgi:hypothetical protein